LAINYKNLSKISKDVSLFDEAQLMIVSKQRSQEDVVELIANGFRLFGENRVQEMEEKFLSLKKSFNFSLHLIGPLQSNKVKQVLKIADTIQSIDRKKIVDEILKHLNDDSVTKNFYIQINVGREAQKSGVMPEKAKGFYTYCIENNLPISGLMCIPPNIEDPSPYFKEMISLRDQINQNLKLSMGMSGDYLLALKNKSNIIRVGSLLFE
tara:strand:+ start:6266 stop:6895 length:630 start_codon:yes stop_codon:yes gene_type:complete